MKYYDDRKINLDTQVEDEKPLDDFSKMPFGKHEGVKMENVPASYLHWVWTECKVNQKNSGVIDYIKRNLSSLKTEHRDGIWTRPSHLD